MLGSTLLTSSGDGRVCDSRCVHHATCITGILHTIGRFVRRCSTGAVNAKVLDMTAVTGTETKKKTATQSKIERIWGIQ